MTGLERAARELAVLALQSDRYGRDLQFKEAVDTVLALTVPGPRREPQPTTVTPGGNR